MKTQQEFQQVADLFARFAPEMLDPFLTAVSSSKAREDLLPSDLVQGILELEGQLVLGGQEAFFVQNVLAQFSKDVTPVIHLPSRSKKFVQYLLGLPNAERLHVFDVKDGKPVVVPLSDISTTDEPAPVHAIIEYQKDQHFTYNNCQIDTSRANRYIASFDVINSKAALDPFLLSGLELIDKDWIVLYSGYHLVTSDVLTPEFRETHLRVAQALERANWTHYELAFTNDADVRVFIEKTILPHCNSVGLNEVELRQTATEVLAGQDLSQLNDGQVLLRYFEFLKATVPTIFWHALGVYAVLDASGSFTAEQLERGFKLSDQYIVNTRQVAGSQFSTMDQPYLEALRAGGAFAYQPRLVAPISSTVGLGDTISSSIVVGSLLMRK